MPDPATPPGADSLAGGGPPAGPLTPEAIDAVLADFRGWLTALAAPPPSPADEPPAVDLATVVAQVTALRHEVNLQTKASRAAVEQTAEALKLAATSATAADPAETVRPLAKTLIEIADALAVGLRQAQKVRTGMSPLLDEFALASGRHTAAADSPDLPAAVGRPSLWRRLFPRRPPDGGLDSLLARVSDLNRQQWERVSAAAESARQSAAGLADGYAMSLRRVERALPSFGLEAVEVVGWMFDPETMEAVEVVDGAGRPAGTVVDEVRRGYRWHGKPFRAAQVKVAR